MLGDALPRATSASLDVAQHYMKLFEIREEDLLEKSYSDMV